MYLKLLVHMVEDVGTWSMSSTYGSGSKEAAERLTHDRYFEKGKSRVEGTVKEVVLRVLLVIFACFQLLQNDTQSARQGLHGSVRVMLAILGKILNSFVHVYHSNDEITIQSVAIIVYTLERCPRVHQLHVINPTLSQPLIPCSLVLNL